VESATKRQRSTRVLNGTTRVQHGRVLSNARAQHTRHGDSIQWQ
jgi:hypothetical protein